VVDEGVGVPVSHAGLGLEPVHDLHVAAAVPGADERGPLRDGPPVPSARSTGGRTRGRSPSAGRACRRSRSREVARRWMRRRRPSSPKLLPGRRGAPGGRRHRLGACRASWTCSADGCAVPARPG
jgi:hypothetical protein